MAQDQLGGVQRRTAYEPDPRRWRILAVTLVVGFMSLLDVTIVNVAIPSMQQGLGTSASTVQWVVSGYALAFGLVLVTGGRLGDAFGRRRLMLVGLVGFVTASALVGLAPSVELVIAARLLQGMSAGLLTPQNSGIIQTLFRGAERGRAFGLFGFVVSVSSALGPVLGGLIITLAGGDDGWRWIFWVNLPVGILAFVLVLVVVPRDLSSEDFDGTRPRLDLVGAALLGLLVLCVIYPLVSIEGGGYRWLVLLAAVPPLAWGFTRWEHRVVTRGGEPLLDVALLRRTPGFASGIAVGSLYFTGFTGMVLVLAVHLQTELGLGPLAAGAALTGFAAGSAISSPIAGRFVTRIGRPLTVGALVITLVAVLVLVVVLPGQDASGVAWVLVPLLLVAGLGGGAVISPNITLTLDEVPPRMGGAAGGALQTGQRIGSALGTALGITAYTVGSATYDAATGLRAALLVAALMVAASLAVAVKALRD
ncbi:MFS transporter [Nocardioides sp.]|uniref:MFS transporter n=1 Tax=Nocardioides sp. TaxID=35761 RepID=UPI00263737F5|nr:MFS transporter [Nocardioides sp.]